MDVLELAGELTDEEPVRELSGHECWALLAARELGWIGYHLGPEVHLSPVNYSVDSETLLLRTAPGSKLVGVLMNPDVVFGVEAHDDHRAVSVIVRGSARRLDEDQAHRAENVPLRPWVATPKEEVVEIRPTEVTGRAFHLHRPWLQLSPEQVRSRRGSRRRVSPE